MKNKSPTLIILISLIVLSACLLALYIYLFSSVSEISKKEVAVKNEYKDASTLLRQEQENKKLLQKYFVSEGEQATFVSSLESVCVGFNLVCTTRSLDEQVATEMIKVLSMTLSAEGSLANITALTNYFEQYSYPVIVSKAILTSTDDSWEGVFSITVPVMSTTQ